MLIEMWSEEARKAAAETRRKNAEKRGALDATPYGAKAKKQSEFAKSIVNKTTIANKDGVDKQASLAAMSKANKFDTYSDGSFKTTTRAGLIRAKNKGAVDRSLGVRDTRRGKESIGYNPDVGFSQGVDRDLHNAGVGTKAVSGMRGGAMAAGTANKERSRYGTAYDRDGNAYGGEQNTYDTHKGQLGPRKRAKGPRKAGILNTLKKALMKSPRKVDLTKSTDK
jgi:hypothetical protein